MSFLLTDVGEIVASISEHCQAIQEREDREKYDHNDREIVPQAEPFVAVHQPRQLGRQATRERTPQPRYVQPTSENSFTVEDQPSRQDVVIVRQEVSL